MNAVEAQAEWAAWANRTPVWRMRLRYLACWLHLGPVCPTCVAWSRITASRLEAEPEKPRLYRVTSDKKDRCKGCQFGCAECSAGIQGGDA